MAECDVVGRPRLTTAIRKFGHVTEAICNHSFLSLTEKRYFKIARDQEQCLTWLKLKTLVKNNIEVDRKQCDICLERLYQLCVDIVGCDAPSDIVDLVPGCIFCLLAEQDKISKALTNKLEAQFGILDLHLISETKQAVDDLTRCLSSVGFQMIVNNAVTRINDQFGRKVKFSFEDITESNMPHSLLESEHVFLSDGSDEETFAEVVLGDASLESLNIPESNSTSISVPVGSCTAETSTDRVYELLLPQADALGMPVDQLLNSVVHVLASCKSNNAIQNELFELIGYDGFETIQVLLDRRHAILETYFQPVKKIEETSGVHPVKPGSQVTVQSASAIDHQRQLQRDRKRQNRASGAKGGCDPVASTFHGDIVDRLLQTPWELARRRQEQQAARAPELDCLHTMGLTIQPSFPYVFDQLAAVRATAAFIGGAKLCLPKDTKQENVEMYEEVVFLPTEKPPNELLVIDRVQIASMDEVGQAAFKGMKQLNLIQSVVYETAYGTNENLLVSAPTGAGKTNVALLTVLHEIKQHLGPGGIIALADFKIIYIAPMKALASEMTRTFGGRLAPLGIRVRECTGDMQLSKQEILNTQMLVTTPEKWDVITRKSTGDVALVQLVKLLIIDEVHLLHEDRGAVIESIVARTLRQVESSQRMIRIVGLSATLPNYLDVARFLCVNPMKGMFYFDARFRPVPLGQTFVGVKATNKLRSIDDMNLICYKKVLDQVKSGEQVMVFVHARGETFRTAMFLRNRALEQNDIEHFRVEQSSEFGKAFKQVSRSRDGPLQKLFPDGFACHHAGMLRADRTLVECLFAEGHIRVLCCTATLAWGVNLPAHAVIIKGTQIYDAAKSTFVDLGILDVLQIFGRAGRPQFDTVGFGTIITTHDKLAHYLGLITRQNPIESQFLERLNDNLNAEIALGTVSNIDEAVRWLSYTYLFIRLKRNPLNYGISYTMLESDPDLVQFQERVVREAAKALDAAEMIRYEERTGYLSSTDRGRTASHYYIKFETALMVKETLHPHLMEPELFTMIARTSEFSQMKVREEELAELSKLADTFCPITLLREDVTFTAGKVNVLLQAYISSAPLDTFSLVSDQNYIEQNAARLIRFLFEVSLRQGWPLMAANLLNLAKMVERRRWSVNSPLWQFEPEINHFVMERVDALALSVDKIREMSTKELGVMVHHQNYGPLLHKFAFTIPRLEMSAEIQPITRSVIRVRLSIKPDFIWADKWHGTGEPFWIWVEDPENNHIYHSEYWIVTKKLVRSQELHVLVFTIPVFEPLPAQYIIRAVSDRWLGADYNTTLSFRNIILPELHPPHTELLDLQPLPIAALNDPKLESIFSFPFFNPIQTQIFHTLYHTDRNVLLGAPTGSGKTVAAELAIFRVFNHQPGKKCVYIAPLKALVRERVEDWKIKIEQKLGKKVMELTGDVTPDMRAVAQSDLIVTTPEKWDGVSRSWQQRCYVTEVALIVIDEIHLLGEERGPVLEVIVSRTNFITEHTGCPVRVVGLSTALANARDLADWLNIRTGEGMFNFRPSVRPVPLEVHIKGFTGRHYCPRMATMNRPIYQDIRSHSPEKPVLVFVSSRRQTRLTALDLIAFLAADDNPKQWLHMEDMEISNVIETARDANLKLTLAFGIGIHHAGLQERDRRTIEELFAHQKIQVLIATSTLAWGVNFPAHLVIVKGTEFFDGKTKRYVDYPITDVLQMMGRAGRPQFDNQGKAIIMVHDVKKAFYKRFLYEPFPVESNLLSVFSDHLNAEVVAGTIASKQDAMDYFTWTFCFRRLLMNPSYYHLESADHAHLNTYLSRLVERSLLELTTSHCLAVGEDGYSLTPEPLGRIASFYYLNHLSMRLFRAELGPDISIEQLLNILSRTEEYALLPVRHNEDQLNAELATQLPLPARQYNMDSPHTKAFLLLQAHFVRRPLPIADYLTDTKSVLDQAIRIMQAMIDWCAAEGWLLTSLRCINVIQMLVQGRWLHDSSILQLPHLEDYHLTAFRIPWSVAQRQLDLQSANVSRSSIAESRPSLEHGYVLIETLPELIEVVGDRRHWLDLMLLSSCSREHVDKIYQTLRQFPLIEVGLSVSGWWSGSTREEERLLPSAGYANGTRCTDQDWLPLHADQEYVLNVRLVKMNFKSQRADLKAFAPRFPKSKEEGWLLVLGDPESRELLALRRLPRLHRAVTSVPLVFCSPSRVGHRVRYTLYLLSDAYLGLDQQLCVCLHVLPPDQEAMRRGEERAAAVDVDSDCED